VSNLYIFNLAKEPSRVTSLKRDVAKHGGSESEEHRSIVRYKNRDLLEVLDKHKNGLVPEENGGNKPPGVPPSDVDMLHVYVLASCLSPANPWGMLRSMLRKGVSARLSVKR
jgi:hypothetical protein